MEPTRKIVVGIDGSEGSLDALAVASKEAVLWGAELEVVLAWDFLDQPGDAPFDPHFTQVQAEDHVRLTVEGALAADGPGSVTTRAVCDRPANALLDAGRDADLIVVGARGKGGFLGLRLGSVSQAVVTHSRRPVMVVRGGIGDEHPVSGGSIVVGVDGSEHSRRALAWARDEATARGADLTAVHGWIPSASVAELVPVSPVAAFADAAQSLVDGEVSWVREAAPDLEVQGQIATTTPARAVLDAAHNASLIVVGGRGRGGFTGLLLGSVSQQVLHHAECPVVVVPQPPVA